MSTLINHPLLCINIWYFLFNFFLYDYLKYGNIYHLLRFRTLHSDTSNLQNARQRTGHLQFIKFCYRIMSIVVKKNPPQQFIFML